MSARLLALAVLLCPLVSAAAETPPPVVYTLEEAVRLPASGNIFLTGADVRIPVPAAVAGAAAPSCWMTRAAKSLPEPWRTAC